MAKLLVGALAALEYPASHVLLLSRDGDEAAGLELRFVFSRRQGIECISACHGCNPPDLSARAVKMLVISGLPKEAGRPPVSLHGLAAGCLWSPLADAWRTGSPKSFAAMELATREIIGFACAWIPTHPGVTAGFIVHTESPGRHVLTLVRSRGQVRRLIDRYAHVEKPEYLASIRERLAVSVLPESSDDGPDDIEGGLVSNIRAALMLMEDPRLTVN